VQQLEGAASRGGEQIDDGLDRFVGMNPVPGWLDDPKWRS
jgi:hypothetical protein